MKIIINANYGSVMKSLLLLLFLVSNSCLAGLNSVKTIIITPSKLNKSGWLQVSEIIATQASTGNDLALNLVGAVASGSPSYSKAANPSNIISGVGPDIYPRIYHSKNNDGLAWVKATLKTEAELDSITIYGRKKGDSRRDIYNISVLNTEGEIIFSKRNLSASNKSNSVSVDLTGDISKNIQPKSIEVSTNNKVASSKVTNKADEHVEQAKTIVVAPGTNSPETSKSNSQSLTKQPVKPPQQSATRVKRSGGFNYKQSQLDGKTYAAGRTAYNNKQYDDAEVLFKQIITSSNNSILVGGAKNHLELIAQDRNKQVRRDISKAKWLQRTKPVDISNILGEDLFIQALKSWSNHRDKEATKLLGKYITLGNSAKRSLDANMLLKVMRVMKEQQIPPRTTQPSSFKSITEGITADSKLKNIDGSFRDASTGFYYTLSNIDRKYRRAIEGKNEKFLPYGSNFSEQHFSSFSENASEDIVMAFYQRADKYRAFFYSLSSTASPAAKAEMYEKLIQPLSTEYNKTIRTLYSSLTFTIIKESSKTGERELQLSVRVEANDSIEEFKNYEKINSIFKHHLKGYLLSRNYDAITKVNADYSFYYDYQPYDTVLAQYTKTSWDFAKGDTSKMVALTRPLTKEQLQKIADNRFKLPPLKAITGKGRSQKQILSLLEPIQNKINTLLTGWRKHQDKPLPNLERGGHQTDMVEYSRDAIPSLMDDLIKSALMLLHSIDRNDAKAYSKWDRELSKPIRKILGDGLTLWNYGFNNDTKSKVKAAFGDSNYTDPFTFGKIQDRISTLIAYQYDWVKKNRVGTIADPDLQLPAGISGGAANITYKKPVLLRSGLDTPTVLFFEGLGQQAGQAGAYIISYIGQLAEFEKQINEYRKAYFECYPKCDTLDANRAKFSSLLIQKDAHYLKLSGNYNALTDRLDRGLSALIEITGAKQDNSILDGGIPYRCRGEFKTWAYSYSQSLDSPLDKQVNNAVSAMEEMGKGNFGALQKMGKNKYEAQQMAFKRTSGLYGRYQICRDQWEFDSWEDKHGDLDDGFSF